MNSDKIIEDIDNSVYGYVNRSVQGSVLHSVRGSMYSAPSPMPYSLWYPVRKYVERNINDVTDSVNNFLERYEF